MSRYEKRWRLQAVLLTTFRLTMPRRLQLIFEAPAAPMEVQLQHAWNFEDCSLGLIPKENDPLVFRRDPTQRYAHAIRGKVGHSTGLHVWQINWPFLDRGLQASVGVGTAEAPLYAADYTNLVGNNDHSWGWNSVFNRLYHGSGNETETQYPNVLPNGENLIVLNTFYVVLDMDEGTLSYIIDNFYMGVAFRGLKGKTVYPMASTVWEHCNVTMKYIGGIERQPLPLKDLCRRVIRNEIGIDNEQDILKLDVPTSIKNYLLHR